MYAVSDTNCSANSGDISGTDLVVVYPRPTATVTGTTTICNGQQSTVQAALTGTGPTWQVTWQETWADGSTTIGTNYSTANATLTLAPADTAANAPTNYTFTVIALTDSSPPDCGAQPGDLTGSAVVTVNPRPTASLLSFNTTDCDEGPVYTLTNTLTGNGPWVVVWNDGLVQTNLSIGAGPSTLNRTVYPTNTFGADSASNNVYYVTNVVDADSCVGNQAGDITGVVTNTIDPRPTAVLEPYNPIDCDTTSNSYVFTVDLTGVGPWTVQWNDGSSQTTNASPLLRTVYPTNSFQSNVATTNTYYVTNVVDADGCVGDQPGDIAGTNVAIINPRPTATVIQAGNSSSNLVTFDDLPETDIGIPVTNGYANLNWVNFYEIDGDNAGVPNGVVSTNNVAYNAYGSPASITNSAPFDLASAYLTAWVTDGLQVTVLGYNSGILLYSNVYTLSTSGPQLVAFDYSNVTEVDFSAVGGSDWFVMDNVTIGNGTPSQAVCNGGSVELQAALTGIGPWTVTWSDGSTSFVQTTNGSPATLFVSPPDAFLNMPTNYYYTVTGVSNADTCSGNLPGDLAGTALVTVNPRPTATLLPFSTADCDAGTNNYALAAVLTGIGPWTVVWNDGYVQTTNASPGSAQTLVRTVYPTNSFGANTATTNVYYVVAVSNADTCLGNLEGDISGTNVIIINPAPTATLSITNTDIAAFGYNGSNMLLSVSMIGTNIYVHTAFSYYSVTNQVRKHGHPFDPSYWTTNYVTNAVSFTNITLRVTNHVALTGIKVWTNTWSDGYATTNKAYSSYVANYVWVETVSKNTSDTNYTFTITALTDGTGCPAGTNGLMGGFLVTVNGTPSANTYLSGPSSICNGDGTQIEVDLGGVPPWTVTWSDGAVSNNVTTTPLYRVVSPPDSFSSAATNYSYSVTNLSDAFTNTSDTVNDLTGVATVTVDPPPAGPPTSLGDVSSCYGVSVPLLVSVPDGFTADWYGDPTLTNLLASGQTNYTPAIVNANMATTNVYWVVERFNDPNLLADDCISASNTVSLVLLNCTNPPAISLVGTNGTIQWFGDLTLQSTTNLLPANWVDVTNGGMGTNSWYWTNGLPPWTNSYYFFRLYTN